MLTKIYSFETTSLKSDGLLRFVINDGKITGKVYISGSEEDFLSPVGKTFSISAEIVSFKNKSNKDITYLDKFKEKSKETLFIFSSFTVKKTIDDKDITGNYLVTISEDWKNITLASIVANIKKLYSTVNAQATGVLSAEIPNADIVWPPNFPPKPPVVDPNPPTTPEPPIIDNGVFIPMMGVSGLTYYWYTARDTNKLVSALDTVSQICKSLSIPKNLIVFTLETHSDGGKPGANIVNWKTHFKNRCEELPKVVKIIESYGFGTVIYAWNSNTPGKGYSKSWDKSKSAIIPNRDYILPLLRTMVKVIGWDRTMWSLCNEDDNSTHEIIRNAIRGLKNELNIPDNRYLSKDVHPSSVKNLPNLSSPQTFSSDNGGIISELYENSNYWNASGCSVSTHIKVIDKYFKKVPFFFYNLVLEDTLVKNKVKWYDIFKHFKSKLGNTYDAPVTPESPTIPTNTLSPSLVKWLSKSGKIYTNAKIVMNITSAKVSGDRLYFKTDKPFPSNWKPRGEKSVSAVGFLIRYINNEYIGGKCEWCVESRGWYDITKNVKAGYNGHTLPKPGETVWCGLGHPDNGSECSALVPVKWPSTSSFMRIMENVKSWFRKGEYNGEFKDLE